MRRLIILLPLVGALSGCTSTTNSKLVSVTPKNEPIIRRAIANTVARFDIRRLMVFGAKELVVTEASIGKPLAFVGPDESSVAVYCAEVQARNPDGGFLNSSIIVRYRVEIENINGAEDKWKLNLKINRKSPATTCIFKDEKVPFQEIVGYKFSNK